MTEVDSKKIVEKLTEVIELLKKEPEVVEKVVEPEVDCCNKCPFKKMLMEECKKECKKTGKCPKECVEVKDKTCICKDCPCKEEDKKVDLIEEFEVYPETSCRKDEVCPFNGILFLLFLIIFIVSLIKIIKFYAASGCCV